MTVARTEVSFRVAFACLIAGAVGIAFAPIFVRWSEVGPSATAFYRLLLALPVFAAWQVAWVAREPAPIPRAPGQSEPGSQRRSAVFPGSARDLFWLVLPGLFFAGDLALWHWSIRLTSVANATLFANFAPILVTIVARVLFLEQIRPVFVVGLLLASTGALFVVGSSAILARGQVLGDLLGLATAFFYAGYLLSVKQARRRHSTLVVMIWSSLGACPVLGVLALLSGEVLVPRTVLGWVELVGLACVSQIAGQGLIAFAFRHLAPPFSAVSLPAQPLVAALLAWAFLREPLSVLPAVGCFAVLMSIGLASAGRS